MRQYRCLICTHRPVTGSRLETSLHVRTVHPELLERHHIGELLIGFGEDTLDVRAVDSRDRVGPYICLLCANNSCVMEDTMRLHHKNFHENPSPEYRVDYISEDDRADLLREEALQRERQVDAFARRLESIRGVGDLLTDCGD